MVPEDRRRKQKLARYEHVHRVYSLKCPAARQTKESVYIRTRTRTTSAVSLFFNINMAATCRHVHTLYTLLWCIFCFLIAKTHYYLKTF